MKPGTERNGTESIGARITIFTLRCICQMHRCITIVTQTHKEHRITLLDCITVQAILKFDPIKVHHGVHVIVLWIYAGNTCV